VRRIAANKGRALQAADPASRRKLFDGERKATFLEWFAATASLSWSSRQAGVHYRTVIRHKMEDADFAAAFELAEAQAAPRLRAWLAEVREEAARAMEAAVAGEDSEEIGPGRLGVEQAMQFLRDFEAMEARRARALARSPGAPGRGRPVSVASNEEVREALVKALWAHGIRIRSISSGMKSGEDALHPLPPCQPLHQPSAGHEGVQTAPGSPQPSRGDGGPLIPRPGED
jgi:hypothetical protein